MEFINDYNFIVHFLSIIKNEVEIKGKLNLHDENIFCEKIFCDVLNLTYNLNLRNSNVIENNEAAFDLDDRENKIVFQVTSEKTSAKIKHTIEEFIENKCYSNYDVLKVVLIANKQKFNTTFDTKGFFTFDKDTDIIDIVKLTKDIYKLSPEIIHEIKLKLESYNLKDYKIEFANEEQTIIDLINKITESNDYSDEISTIIDPEYKIDTRIKSYSNAIKEEYINAKKLYGDVFETIISDLSKRDILKLEFYLRNKSIEVLNETKDNPIKGLNTLVLFFSNMIKAANVQYDLMAIRYFIVYEIIECNIFPNIKEGVVNA